MTRKEKKAAEMQKLIDAAVNERLKSSPEISSLKALYKFLEIDSSGAGTVTAEATYYACQKVLSETIAKLPLKILKWSETDGVRPAREHRWYRVLNERPNRFMTSSVFWGYMEYCRNHYGNAYAYIDQRDPRNPQLFPIDPNTVDVIYDDGCILRNVPDIYYRVSDKNGFIVLGSEELLHFKTHETRDGIVGVPVREQLRATILGNVKAQGLINHMYDSGMTSKAAMQYTGNLSDANAEELARGLQRYMNGEMKNRGIENIIPMPLGVTLQPLNMKLADSQFLELRQYSSMQVASAFGLKPYQIGDYTKSSYSSAEAQQIAFLVDTLLYIVKAYEEEISWKLLSTDEEQKGYHVKFNTAAILRVDRKTQIDTLSKAVNSFLMTPNEGREELDLPHKTGGDELLGNGASIPVQYTGSQYVDLSGKEGEKWVKSLIADALRT